MNQARKTLDPETRGLISSLALGLELGPARKVFAQVIDWPGWCRAGRNEAAAISAVESTLGRYRSAVGPLAAPLGSGAPSFTVMERVEGSATTDFGAPDRALASDRRPLEQGEPERLAAFLDACWAAFDAAVGAVPEAARETRPPVGRSPLAIRDHVAETRRLHLSWLLRPIPRPESTGAAETDVQRRRLLRNAVLSLAIGVPFESDRYPGPYVVRRECWHALDHAWELEDRITPS
jgi:hypothetical protein